MTTTKRPGASRAKEQTPLLPRLTCPRCHGEGTLPDGKGLAALRDRLGFTVTAFAQAIGISPQYLCMIESGVTPLSPRVYANIERKFKRMRPSP